MKRLANETKNGCFNNLGEYLRLLKNGTMPDYENVPQSFKSMAEYQKDIFKLIGKCTETVKCKSLGQFKKLNIIKYLAQNDGELERSELLGILEEKIKPGEELIYDSFGLSNECSDGSCDAKNETLSDLLNNFTEFLAVNNCLKKNDDIVKMPYKGSRFYRCLEYAVNEEIKGLIKDLIKNLI